MLMKRSPLRRKAPLRRGSSSLLRKTPLKTGGRQGTEAERRKGYLRRFRGQPCEKCGKTSYAGQKSTAHHILKAENYPEYYYEEWNRAILCPLHHVPWAHDREWEFLAWLKETKPEQWRIVEDHRHHRRESCEDTQ
jgi:hypothetical protein